MTNKAKAWLYTLFSCLAYLLVMAALFIWKWDELINDRSSRIGTLGFVVIGLVLICLKSKICKFIESSNVLFTFSLLGLVCCLGVTAMTEQLTVIFAFSLFGSAVSGIFDKVVRVYNDNSYKVIDGIREPNKSVALSDKEAWARAFGINFKAE